MTLSVENASWAARRVRIVEDISLALRPGETLGLIGPNGSGKSTLLRLMAGIREPAAGEVTLGGVPLRRMRRRDVARRIALVEQQADTGEPIDVRDAVELGRTPWLSALAPWSSRDDAAVARALADVAMQGFERRHWHTLSGGERQRVHIARALAQQPDYLLLDEPTNHLDIRHQLAILQLVRGLAVTTVIALHDLNQAMQCDRVAVLDHGRLVALGPPDDIITHALVHRIFAVGARFLTDAHDGRRVIRFHLPEQVQSS